MGAVVAVRGLQRVTLLALCALLFTLSGCQTLQEPDSDRSASEAADAEPPPPPCPDQSVAELEREAIELLDRGDAVEARRLLDCAIEQNPRARRAGSLIKQLDTDPVQYLGARHYWYTVSPSETLSKIAEQRLGNSLEFVVLARYNSIPVPASLVAGQRIKIPGERPPDPPQPSADPTPNGPKPPPGDVPPPTVDSASVDALYDAAVSAEADGDLALAHEKFVAVQAAAPNRSGIDDDVARVRKALVVGLEERAYREELDGNLDGAIGTWRQILEVDPNNIPAQLSIRRLTQ